MLEGKSKINLGNMTSMIIGASIASIAFISFNALQVPATAPRGEKTDILQEDKLKVDTTNGILLSASEDSKKSTSTEKEIDFDIEPNTKINVRKHTTLARANKKANLELSTILMQDIKQQDKLLLKDNSIVIAESVVKKDDCWMMYAKYVEPAQKDYLIECYSDIGIVIDDVNSILSISGIIRP